MGRAMRILVLYAFEVGNEWDLRWDLGTSFTGQTHKQGQKGNTYCRGLDKIGLHVAHVRNSSNH
jgi:hypothetical protein